MVLHVCVCVWSVVNSILAQNMPQNSARRARALQIEAAERNAAEQERLPSEGRNRPRGYSRGSASDRAAAVLGSRRSRRCRRLSCPVGLVVGFLLAIVFLRFAGVCHVHW